MKGPDGVEMFAGPDAPPEASATPARARGLSTPLPLRTRPSDRRLSVEVQSLSRGRALLQLDHAPPPAPPTPQPPSPPPPAVDDIFSRMRNSTVTLFESERPERREGSGARTASRPRARSSPRPRNFSPARKQPAPKPLPTPSPKQLGQQDETVHWQTYLSAALKRRIELDKAVPEARSLTRPESEISVDSSETSCFGCGLPVAHRSLIALGHLWHRLDLPH